MQFCRIPAAIFAKKFSDDEDADMHANLRDDRSGRRIAYGGSAEGKNGARPL